MDVFPLEAAKSHKKERKEQKGKVEETEGGKIPSTEEFLSGFWKEDKLIPSITVTILFSSKPWDGPLSLFDMMEVSDPAVQACMDNYHVRLIAPAQMTDVPPGNQPPVQFLLSPSPFHTAFLHFPWLFSARLAARQSVHLPEV